MRFVITLLACLGLITFALMEFPSGSHASQNRAQRRSVTKKRTRPEFKPGEVLVRYRSEALARTRVGRTVVASPSGELVSGQVEPFEGADLVPGLRLVRVAPEQTLAAVAALRRQPDVLYAEPNYILHADVVPNDPLLNVNPIPQYGITKIGVQNVWDNFTTGSSNVVVAVIDQGVDIEHQDLAANIWTNPSPGSLQAELQITGDLHGYDFNSNSGNFFSGNDAENHATHVAGIIGATGNNGVGITGVNWNVRLMSLKFLNNDGRGDTANAIRACTYARRMRELWNTQGPAKGANIRVINASFGGDRPTQSFLDAINALNTAGILFVAAAGNADNGSLEPNNDLIPHFPSSFNAPNIIAVAATDQADGLASFSHFGRGSVDIGAPGDDILSTTPPCTDPGPFPEFPCDPFFPSNFGVNDDTYSYFDGTSMAAPFVSGAAALLWAQNPNLTVQQVKSLLLLNGNVQSSLVDKTLTGRRLNVANSFQSLQQTDNTAPGAVTNFHLQFQNGRTFNIGWTASGDDGATGTASLYELSFIDSSSNAVIPLRGIIPAAPGTAQNTQVTIPYRHTAGTIRLREFDNKGNEGTPVNLPLTISPLEGDPYVASVGPFVPLTPGGTQLEFEGDDRYVDFLLPNNFSVPFFGTNFTEVTISTNGNLFFSQAPVRKFLEDGDLEEADDPPGAPQELGGYKMIAGFWEDLIIDPVAQPGAGVYVTQLSNPSRLIFRWLAQPCNFNFVTFRCAGGSPVNFEIELRTDGTIKTRYGSGNSQLFPTVGIGGGDQEGYFIPSHTAGDEKITLNNAGEVTFTPRAPWVQTTLTDTQVELKSWQNQGRTFVHAKLLFPDGGFRVVDWGTATRSGNTFTTDAIVEHFNGPSPKAIASTAQIWDLGALAPGTYSFVFKTSGTTVKTLPITVSATAPPPNEIDNARFFVRWQYKDFLRREPDGPGWDHWTFEITQCSDIAFRRPGESEAQCIERKRENTSAAFFVSPESQNIAYFVLRVYRGSLGRMPFFGGGFGPNDEFTRDAATVGQDIVANNALDHNRINTNKQAFVNAFVTRPDFRAIYDPLNNTQYVDKLFQTTGVTPSAGDRQALINGLNGGETRASVLFKVVDGTTTGAGGLLTFNTVYGKAFYDNLFNAAFVQMEYFGYLQRDPDPGGFAFWLGKLNSFGDWVNAEMVKAFINSPEYRARFGAP